MNREGFLTTHKLKSQEHDLSQIAFTENSIRLKALSIKREKL